jgi:hypothetical protein
VNLSLSQICEGIIVNYLVSCIGVAIVLAVGEPRQRDAVLISLAMNTYIPSRLSDSLHYGVVILLIVCAWPDKLFFNRELIS